MRIGGNEWRRLCPRFERKCGAGSCEPGRRAAATAIIGFSQGATIALESTVTFDDLAARAVGISGRFAALPERVPETATIHLLHGKEDTVVPYRHTVDAAQHLLRLGADVTADVVPFIGHEIDDELIDLLLQRLQTHVPRRIWQEAMRDVPAPGTDASN